MASASQDPALQLARRLRSLRKQGMRGKRITQEQLAEAFGVSVPLISSWERSADPTLPPPHRLEAYATFFATGRSVERRPFRLLTQLGDEEQTAKDSLLSELNDLRNRALDEAGADNRHSSRDDLWRFPLNEDVTIVCSELPERVLQDRPSTDPEDPDFVALYRYSDLDSLLELHGHIRATNPDNDVYVRPGSLSLEAVAYTSHLVLLGGVDWNQVTAEMLHRIDLPIRQQERPDDSDVGGFQVVEDGALKTFRPLLRTSEGRQVLEEDIAHFYRSRNPFNLERTVTICNGIFSRGVLGAVLALTDRRFRGRNTTHALDRFAGKQSFSILSRVPVVQGSVVTPDWTNPHNILHEWAM
ncbi:Transcriptional regulator, contains XRE-family HTH domain [Lentzea fradiae]|uniref:Transcriptional regulator, contains XRE-family HTH domain n=1 Tax=Lentzea fradiae TaxID=200378 RepID=A0A1G7R994_9PSEU|nr:helix-turn-helix transcriptional regulator [Lentzea fradiae]SDG06729.1 Transcriptional regulator, contains XRE-family HTH domain [Lentzea fradiae]